MASVQTEFRHRRHHSSDENPGVGRKTSSPTEGHLGQKPLPGSVTRRPAFLLPCKRAYVLALLARASAFPPNPRSQISSEGCLPANPKSATFRCSSWQSPSFSQPSEASTSSCWPPHQVMPLTGPIHIRYCPRHQFPSGCRTPRRALVQGAGRTVHSQRLDVGVLVTRLLCPLQKSRRQHC